MFKSYPLLSRFLLFVVFPVAAALIACFLYLRGSLPADDGRVIKAGVSQPVELTRDENGVAVVNARTDRDAFFAIGFAHAQDRMWQLELERRTAAGRLSEVFGRSAVPQDAWMRALGLYEAAEQSWSGLSPEARDSLTAYAAGVNAWLAQGHLLPPEFIALGVRPEPWREADSLAWSKVFALNLSNNMWNETSNMIASQYLSREQMVDLLGYSQGDLSAAAASRGVMSGETAAGLLAFREGLEGGLKIGGRYVGSNAWVVSGRLMQGGQAALANDPHLGVQMPSPWYVARLKGDRLNVSGMTLVGLPVVIFGQNGDIAWGGTSMMADVQDLYIQQPNPADPSQYKHGDGWAGFQMRSEAINIRADFPAGLRAPVEPVRVQFRRTLDGPVISDIVGAFDQPVSLRWTALDPDDTSYESFLRVNYARDWDTFRDSFRTYVAPALNMLYADKSNNIGSLGVGRIPVRAKGEGRLPVPAWTNEYRWTGYIPFKDWPQRLNPAEGYIVSANDKPVGPDYPYFISADFAPPNRARRIEQLLREKVSKGEPISLDHFGRMQGDTVDLSVGGLLDHLKRLPPSGPEQQKALGYLQNWDGNMSRDSQAAAIFFVWARHLRGELFWTTLKDSWNKQRQSAEMERVVAATSYDQILHALTEQPSAWCGGGSCAPLLSRSLDAAISELKKLRGSDPDSWRWGDIHRTFYQHTPFSEVTWLSSVFERKVPSGGSPDTINVANAVYERAVGYDQTFSAGFRQIVQVGGPSTRHLYMNSTGQSGNVLSAHYDDMVRPFRDVQFRVLDGGAAGGGRANLTITPE
ncbi:MAG TPA: penicillin acylase family protein [Pyrinomonadaceae bacterium]|nr:penicillin acylase family protein [Pyrinomonadaceae bacterium]